MRRRSLVVTVLVGAVLGVVWAGTPAAASAASDGWAGNRGWVTPIDFGASFEDAGGDGTRGDRGDGE